MGGGWHLALGDAAVAGDLLGIVLVDDAGVSGGWQWRVGCTPRWAAACWAASCNDAAVSGGWHWALGCNLMGSVLVDDAAVSGDKH